MRNGFRLLRFVAFTVALIVAPAVPPEASPNTIATDRHEGPITAIAFSPDGPRVATGGEDRIVRLWDARTGGFERAFHGHIRPIASLAFSPTGRELVSGSFDRTVKGDGLPLTSRSFSRPLTPVSARTICVPTQTRG